MKFLLFPLRFEFKAQESLCFPPGQAANILRGALGTIFRRIACVPSCAGAKICEIRRTCPYAKIFEPGQGITTRELSPSGLADWPRPFVFRTRHLDGRILAPGENFHFDLHVFSRDSEILPYFIRTFAALASEGIGPGRGKADLVTTSGLAPVELDLAPQADAPSHIRVAFLSPTELKHEEKVVTRPEFPILFARIRDRIATLSRLYGAGALDIDYAAGVRAAHVKMTRCELRREEARRRSSKTGQAHSLGGFTGFAEYRGDLAEFLPFLKAARWTGVGRQSVWGKGEIEVIETRST